MDESLYTHELGSLLSEAQASDLLNLSGRTLQARRGQGRSFSFVRAGRAVRYQRSDLLKWVREQTVEPATSKRCASPGVLGAGHV